MRCKKIIGSSSDTLKRTASASGCYIIMTSNIMPDRAAEFSAMTQDKLRAILRNYTVKLPEGGVTRPFTPEFIERINYMIPYCSISKEESKRILTDMMNKTIAETGITVSSGSIDALSMLVDPSGGFRRIKNGFTSYVSNFLRDVSSDGNIEFSIFVRAGNICFQLSNRKETLKVEKVKINSSAFDPKMIETLAQKMRARVMGQDSAITEICSHLKIAAAGALPNDRRPAGVFLFAGPSAAGKTETARALSEILCEGRMIHKDMGEYKRPDDSRRFFGDKYTQGELTREVGEMGSCVILLDEVEKANAEVFDALLSLFDQGDMEDAASEVRVSFKNTIIIMTTNLLADQAEQCACLSDDEKRDVLTHFFRTEFLGRLDAVLFYQPLRAETLKTIVKKRVAELIDRYNQIGITITIEDSIYEMLNNSVQTSRYGARALDRIITNTIGAALSEIPEGTEAAKMCVDEKGKIKLEIMPLKRRDTA